MLDDAHALDLVLEVRPRILAVLTQLLERGVWERAPAGIALPDFLQGVLGLDEAYIRERLQSVFLNGKAVDDFERAVLAKDATLALSAAMPGLVGAVMRKGGVLASMRHTATYVPDVQQVSPGGGWVRVKVRLFNLVARDLGAEWLRRGVDLDREVLRNFILRQGDTLWQGVAGCRAQGQAVDRAELLRLLAGPGEAHLTVAAGEA